MIDDIHWELSRVSGCATDGKNWRAMLQSIAHQQAKDAKWRRLCLQLVEAVENQQGVRQALAECRKEMP